MDAIELIGGLGLFVFQRTVSQPAVTAIAATPAPLYSARAERNNIAAMSFGVASVSVCGKLSDIY